MSIPTGRLSRIVDQVISEAFPAGCAHTALKMLKKKARKISPGNEAALKRDFERSDKLKKEDNPERYMEKLINMKNKLRENFNYTKTDQDILDQMTIVLPEEYTFTKHKIQHARRNKNTLDLEDIMGEL